MHEYTDTEMELPRWPSKGDRRNLEQRWLEKLELPGEGLDMEDLPAGAPRQLAKAVEEFNRRLFWECHETLEDVWRETPYPERFFYHAIIKAAVGFHHMSRHNLHGARVKLSDAVRLLRLFQPGCMGLRTDVLLRDTTEWLARLEVDSPVDWAALDALPTPTIREADLGRPGVRTSASGG
jgi:hypothetical protein